MKNTILILAGALVSSFSFGQTIQRTPLYETFTSSTCPPCAPGNAHLEALFDEPENEGKFTSIKYQMSWPGTGDPYYTFEAGNRRGFYAVSSVPRLEVDGGFNMGPTSLTQGDMDAAYAVPAVVALDAYYQVDEAAKTIDIQVRVEALEELESSGGLFLYVGVFEYLTTGNIKTNGETEFEHVMKKMVPTASGSLLGGMDANEVQNFDFSYTFNGDYRLPSNADDPINHSEEHSVEEFSDLGVVVWVQRVASREVYNSMYAKTGTASIEEAASESKAALSIFPNPSNDIAILSYTTPVNTDNATLTIMDNSGKIVSQEQVVSQNGYTSTLELDTKDFDAGLYFVTLNTKDGRVTEKLSVVH